MNSLEGCMKTAKSKIHIPLDGDFSVCTTYKDFDRFRDDTSRYLCVIQKVKGTDKVEVKIYEKELSGSLKKDNLIFSSTPNEDANNNQGEYLYNFHQDKDAEEQGIKILSGITGYMKQYSHLEPKEMAIQREDELEEIKIQEILSEKEEATPDEILEKLWEEEM